MTISEDDIGFDEHLKRWHALLEANLFKLIIEEEIFVKHPIPFTCGIFRTERNFFLSAPLQLFARINSVFVAKRNYEK